MKPAITTAAAIAMVVAFAFQTAEAKLPRFIKSEVICTQYDGVTDDLLTAGLGASGLGLAGAPPALSDPPTAAELRALDDAAFAALPDTVKPLFDHLRLDQGVIAWHPDAPSSS